MTHIVHMRPTSLKVIAQVTVLRVPKNKKKYTPNLSPSAIEAKLISKTTVVQPKLPYFPDEPEVSAGGDYSAPKYWARNAAVSAGRVSLPPVLENKDACSTQGTRGVLAETKHDSYLA